MTSYEKLIRAFDRTFEQESQIPAEVVRTYLEHVDRRAWQRIARVLVVGVLVTGWLIIGLLATGCTARATPGALRSPAEQASAAVLIRTTCSTATEGKVQSGSGVLLDGRTAVTAAHVVECKADQKVSAIALEFADGTVSLATIAVFDHKHDLARLELAAPARATPGPAIASAELGKRVCLVVAFPARRTQCGAVVSTTERGTDDKGMEQGAIRHNAEVHFGNSGSAVYDERGRIVGIVTRLIWCTIADEFVPDHKGRVCGGRVAKVYGRSAVRP